MKFSVSHLGRIRAAEFNIKPLTIFVGKANTNKTWTAYTLYAMLRSMSRSSRHGPSGSPPVRCRQLDSAIETVASRTTKTLIELIESARTLPESVGTGTGSGAGDSEPSFNAEVSRADILKIAHPIGENLRCDFDNDDISQVLAIERDVAPAASASLEFDTESFIQRGKISTIVFTWNRPFWSVFGLSSGGQVVYRHAFALSDKTNEYNLKKQVLPLIRLLAEAIYDDAMAFPAERKGLSAIISLAEAGRKEPFSPGAGLNQAAGDYLRFLFQYQRVGPKPPAFTSKILSHLENQVMNGRADFHGPVEPRIFSYAGQSGPIVQMNASASFVRSMAALDIYLRTVSAQDVIVIDEPEMNAHPEAQLKLVELFAIMANQGRQIVVTTHSPYFVDHLNNLMEGASLKPEHRKQLVPYLKLKDEDAFISQDMAAAYLFNEDGVIQDLVVDGAVDVGSFARETDYLSDFYSRIHKIDSCGKE